jgi:putative addiction module antidote
MTSLKITQVGNSLGVILPKEITEKLNLAKGDELALIETANGIELTPYDPEFEAKMEAARGITKRYRNALRELAK